MNKKVLAGGLASLAVAGLVSGGTFAAWSDYDTVANNQTEAGHLVLDLNGSAPISNVGGQAIAPGEFRTIDFFVASADLDGVPAADLSFTIDDIIDQENGCSSNSEAALDDCETVNDGEFSEESYVRVRYSAPTSGVVFQNNQCKDGSGNSVPTPNGDAGSNDPALWDSLRDLDGFKYALGQLTAGQGICVRFDIGLPSTATDASQGDASNFDLTFDLEQA
jgi:predicted ribosomally synthesized peptide with SipW-like signal peptide